MLTGPKVSKEEPSRTSHTQPVGEFRAVGVLVLKVEIFNTPTALDLEGRIASGAETIFRVECFAERVDPLAKASRNIEESPTRAS